MSDKIYMIADVATRKKAPPKKEPKWFMDLNGKTEATMLHFTSRDLAGTLEEFTTMFIRLVGLDKIYRSATQLAERRGEHFVKVTLSVIINDEPVVIFSRSVYSDDWDIIPSRMALHSYIMNATGVTRQALEALNDSSVWFPKPKARIKYWECPDCNANFPGPAEPVMVLPRHRFLNDVCPGSGRPGV